MIRRNVVVIAASRGGLAALTRLASCLDGAFPGALLVVIHTGPGSPRAMRAIVQNRTSLAVKYGADGEPVRGGHLYLAPPDCHMIVGPCGRLRLGDGPKVNYVRPAADRLFESAARYFGKQVAGVVLTGMGADGTHGLQAIKRNGGISIVQHPAQAEAPGMPMAALNGDQPDFAVSLTELGPLLNAIARGEDGHEFFSSNGRQ